MGAIWPSGDQPTESQGVTIQVSNIQTDIQVLWELDQPPTTTTTLPSFPLRKMYALFVCGATRAVHIEVVTSLALEDFLLAFHKFVARRGQPHQIVSDNAATFKAAAAARQLSGPLIHQQLLGGEAFMSD